MAVECPYFKWNAKCMEGYNWARNKEFLSNPKNSTMYTKKDSAHYDPEAIKLEFTKVLKQVHAEEAENKCNAEEHCGNASQSDMINFQDQEPSGVEYTSKSENGTTDTSCKSNLYGQAMSAQMTQ